MEIDRKNPVPVYHQIYRIMKEEIEKGVFQSGDYLPSEEELAKIYDVSRLTLRQALRKLCEEGIIEKKKGKRSKIVQIKNVENLSELKGFTQDAILSGHSASSIVLANKLVDLPDEVGETFKIPKESKVILLNRLRLLDNIPYAIEWAYINIAIDVRMLNLLETDMSASSLYEFFRKNIGLKLEYADETLEVVMAGVENAKLLGIQTGSCLLFRKRFTYSSTGKCVEYVQSYYRGDRYKFNVRIRA
uniref:GntR family transcriptional regulator n=1 Tax=Mesoaciditoga lauensis TaxID=1495039 RepID=A0A7V3REB9_9BACT